MTRAATRTTRCNQGKKYGIITINVRGRANTAKAETYLAGKPPRRSQGSRHNVLCFWHTVRRLSTPPERSGERCSTSLPMRFQTNKFLPGTLSPEGTTSLPSVAPNRLREKWCSPSRYSPRPSTLPRATTDRWIRSGKTIQKQYGRTKTTLPAESLRRRLTLGAVCRVPPCKTRTHGVLSALAMPCAAIRALPARYFREI